jgi:hypothetical protein
VPPTQVTIQTTVVALVSCDNTKAWITQDGRHLDGAVALSAGAVHVHVAARDVDDLNVTATRAELDLRWGMLALEFRWQRDEVHGSNEYVASLPLDLESSSESLMERRKVITVTLRGGWSQSGGENGSCLLLQRPMELQEAPPSIQYYVLGGSLVTCAVVVGSLVLFVRRYSQQLENIFRTLVTELAVLVFHLIFEASDLGTDIYTWYRAVVDDSLGASEATKSAYSVLMAFALLAYHIRHATLLRQAAVAFLDEATPSRALPPGSADKAAITKLKWEVDHSTRELTSLAITLLTALFEDVSRATGAAPYADPFAQPASDTE